MMKKLSAIFPVMSLAVSIGIVGHEYYRRDTLRSELFKTERTIAQMQKTQKHPVIFQKDDDDR